MTHESSITIGENMRVTARLAIIVTFSGFLLMVGAAYATLEYGHLRDQERISENEAQTAKLVTAIADQSIQLAALRTDTAVVKAILERQERFPTIVTSTTTTRQP